MTKKRRLGLAVVLTIGLCGGLVVWFRLPDEPVYKGKLLHYWLKGYDGNPITILSTGPTSGDADEAVLALGANALPPASPTAWAIASLTFRRSTALTSK
jgi:hypothetical protein